MELPQLQKLWEKYRDRGFEVVAVANQYNLEGQLKFINENNLSITFLNDKKEFADQIESKLYPNPGHPASYIIGRDGKIYNYHIGFELGDEKKLEKEILELLN